MLSARTIESPVQNKRVMKRKRLIKTFKLSLKMVAFNAMVQSKIDHKLSLRKLSHDILEFFHLQQR